MQIPVDPKDPTKGMLTPVADAKTLTAGVAELYDRTERLGVTMVQIAETLHSGIAELASGIAELAELVDDLITLSHGDEDGEAQGRLRTFADAMQAARDEVEAEFLASQAEAPEVPPEADQGT
jgi:X-X-X-Leu-X-X-Gly heptad repeat protein